MIDIIDDMDMDEDESAIEVLGCMRACYVGIFTPGHAYVYADIVIETHGAPYGGGGGGGA